MSFLLDRQGFTLPTAVGPLTASGTFNGTADFHSQTPSNWDYYLHDYSPSLTMIAEERGGCRSPVSSTSGGPISSTIGCQSQSLGEDVPIVGTGFNLHYEGNRAPGAGAR